jgi:hypothetical protein
VRCWGEGEVLGGREKVLGAGSEVGEVTMVAWEGGECRG